LLTAAYGASIGWDVTVVHRGTDLNERAASVGARLVSLGEATTSTPYDVVVDAASGSSPAPLALALELVRDGGTVVVQNAYHPGVRLETPLRDIFRRSVRLVGSFSFCRRGGNDFGFALATLASSRAVFGPLLVDVGGLETLESTVDRAEERRRLVMHLRGGGTIGG
jgi:threonine dehydrogenase-like Zn-dependent dehydrogenase